MGLCCRGRCSVGFHIADHILIKDSVIQRSVCWYTRDRRRDCVSRAPGGVGAQMLLAVGGAGGGVERIRACGWDGGDIEVRVEGSRSAGWMGGELGYCLVGRLGGGGGRDRGVVFAGHLGDVEGGGWWRSPVHATAFRDDGRVRGAARLQ